MVTPAQNLTEWIRYANQGATRNQKLDPELVQALQFLADMGITMEVFSGGQPTSGPNRTGTHRHDLGRAADAFFYDKTGRKLDWADPEDQKIFTDIVRKSQAAGLTGFGAGEGYMQPGSMHLGYGDPAIWGAGNKKENAAPWLKAAYEMKAQGYTDEQIKAAFLSTLAGTEAPGYDVLYGGGKFSDYSRHPNQAIPITSGPNKGKTSSAAGRYQFIYPTWNEQATKLGLKDFSAASQDAAAWNLAQETYAKATNGGDLMEALQSGDPARINAASQILSSQWTSLPGGIEVNPKYGTQTFADVYNTNLSGSVASADPAQPASSPYNLPPGPAPKTKEEKLADLGTNIQKGLSQAWQNVAKAPQSKPQPAAASVVAQPQTSVQQAQADQDRQRQYLAQLLAQLNAPRGGVA